MKILTKNEKINILSHYYYLILKKLFFSKIHIFVHLNIEETLVKRKNMKFYCFSYFFLNSKMVKGPSKRQNFLVVLLNIRKQKLDKIQKKQKKCQKMSYTSLGYNWVKRRYHSKRSVFFFRRFCFRGFFGPDAHI